MVPEVIARDTQKLRCHLTDSEVSQRADEAARKIGELDEKRARQKEIAKEWKQQDELLEKDIRALSREVRERSTYREVECETVAHYLGSRADVIRKDTGELVASRPLEPHEKQRKLRLADEDFEQPDA